MSWCSCVVRCPRTSRCYPTVGCADWLRGVAYICDLVVFPPNVSQKSGNRKGFSSRDGDNFWGETVGNVGKGPLGEISLCCSPMLRLRSTYCLSPPP